MSDAITADNTGIISDEYMSIEDGSTGALVSTEQPESEDDQHFRHQEELRAQHIQGAVRRGILVLQAVDDRVNVRESAYAALNISRPICIHAALQYEFRARELADAVAAACDAELREEKWSL